MLRASSVIMYRTVETHAELTFVLAKSLSVLYHSHGTLLSCIFPQINTVQPYRLVGVSLLRIGLAVD
jgi:hypothetical protein